MCRTRVGFDVNGLGWQRDGRGNICPVTIIMPTLAAESLAESDRIISQVTNSDLTWQNETRVLTFLSLLDRKIHEAKDMLLERFERICSQPKSAATFSYENDIYARLPQDKSIRDILRHGSLAIGNLGLAETLQLLVGCDHTSEYGMCVAKRIYSLFKLRCKEFTTQYSLNFSVYNTPAEMLCYTAMKRFKEVFGVIPNVSDHKYFTNSMHVPVWHECNPFEKIDIESQLVNYSSGGW